MNLAKAQLLYDFIDSNPNFCVSLVDKKYRSRMNVVFRLVTDGIPDVEIEKQFLMKAEKSKLIGLAGHRSVGGLRASIYNSLPIESVQHLIKFLSDSQP